MNVIPDDLGPLRSGVAAALQRLRDADAVGRLWRRDASLWTDQPAVARAIEQRLGWLSAPGAAETFLGPIAALQGEAAAAPRRVVLVGMGGSSLAPEVLAGALGPAGPPLWVLDSTSPVAVRAVEEAGLAHTVYVVSSKSGTTVETRTLAAHLLERAARQPGVVFLGVTDPGTPLARQAESPPFYRVFLNPPDIGGRYSALSFFGLVPSALSGVDVRRLMAQAAPMARACRLDDPAENPGAWLGAVLGAGAAAGRDKVTVVASPGLAGLGAWIEQLIAESTGKQGRGLLPVDGEPPGPPEAYGPDRLFVQIALAGESDRATEARLEALVRAGHPVARLTVADAFDLGAEFFRWETATALAGFLLGINPFDEPNVQQSKDITAGLLEAFRESGRLPEEAPVLHAGGIALSGEAVEGSLGGALAGFLSPAAPPHYVGLLAYLPRTRAFDDALQAMRRTVRDRRRVATTRGFGPRYLHSTGQLFKGGPATGRFLIVTAAVTDDLPVPGEPYSFGTLFAAQALGDIQALRAAGRPVLHLHLTDPARDLPALARALADALPV